MNKFLFELKQFFLTAVRLFYVYLRGGQRCVVCGSKTYLRPICDSCLEKHFSVQKALTVERCIYCGKQLISTKGTCLKCREERVLMHTDKVLPLFSYRLWNKELLFKWKISGYRMMSSVFAELVSKALIAIDVNVVVPVPPRKGKIQKNGWDQIDELCTFLNLRFGFGLFKVLERNSTEQQKKLNRTERLETIKNAYSVCNAKTLSKALKPFNGIIPEKVCLIDDVCTTGSTIECCARLLKEIGVKNVTVVTLFIVD